MNFHIRRTQFKTLLGGNTCVYPASVFDAISGRIAEDLGFEVAMFAGSVASMATLGAPDLMGLTLTEFAGQAYRITRASRLPLLVDADDGYGNAINVMRTVTELEAAGVSAMTLEDTVLPQPFGHGAKLQMMSLEEGVARIDAALEAREDPDFIIVGRTSAAELTGVDDAIARLKAYADAGADAIFPVGVTSRDQVGAIQAAVGKPMIVYVGNDELADLDFLASSGVRVALQPHVPFSASVNAVYETLASLRRGDSPQDISGVASGDLMNRVTRRSDYDEWMRKYIR